MKILLLISSFLPKLGGAEVGLHNIALQLIKKGHEPIVITSYKHVQSLKKEKWSIPYEIICYPPKILTFYKNYPFIGSFVLMFFYNIIQKKYKFDFWHATFGFPVGVSVIEFCNKYKIPHLVRCVGEDIQVEKTINYGMRLDKKIDVKIRKYLPKAQSLIAITESVVNEYKKINIKENCIVRIPNGVNLSYIQNFKKSIDIRKELKISQNTFLFLALGRNHPKKNFIQILKATRKLKNLTKFKFKVLIAGTGVSDLSINLNDNEVEKLVTLYDTKIKKNINSNSLFFVDELPSKEILNIYKSANCFIMPSIIETFGIVTVEAMSFGLPVIVANSPGNIDVVRKGSDALIYDNDEDGFNLAIKMQQILENKLLYQQLKKKSFNRAKYFDWSIIVDKYIKLYHKSIEECN